MNKHRQKYMAPAIVVVSFKSEHGYADSLLPERLDEQINLFLEMEIGGTSLDDFSSRNLEQYNTHSEWGSVADGNHFFE